MATDYSKLKVTELKEILKERGIPQTGLSRKQQIVEALERHDTEQSAHDDGTQVSAADANVGKGDDGEDVQRAGDMEGALEGTEEKTELIEGVADVKPTTVDTEEQQLPEAPSDEGTTKEEDHTTEQPIGSEPIVLEHNDPVSKEPSALNTPQRVSPAADSVSSDTLKRKRRSPTPPLSQDSVNKKLKAAENEDLAVNLPEDLVDERAEGKNTERDVPVAVDRTAESVMDIDKDLLSAGSDDVMRMDHAPDSKPNRGFEQGVGEGSHAAPAVHPTTRALYIRELVRPLQTQQLRSHLLALASPPNGSVDESLILAFHIDTIRTHAFVLFASTTAAARTRSALHGQIWPDEPTRKALWVDFVPDEKVEQWIEMEKQAEEGLGRSSVRRWEVVYDEGEDGVVARLEEANSAPSGPTRQQSTTSAAGQGTGTSNAPLGPRGSRRPSIPSGPSETYEKPSATPTPAPQSASFNVLDERFQHTKTKPKLYYLPVGADLVSKRMDSLASITSRDWNPQREGSFTGNGEIRRYTFEDGDRVVDGGADIGNFGRPQGTEVHSRPIRGGRRGRW